MRANQIEVRALLEGSKQYVLPLYQRRYSWGPKHWRMLADDVDRLLREPDRGTHFIGSIVSAPIEAAADQNVSRWRLIDGQQRLTTVVVLLAALRDVAAAAGQAELADEVHGLYLSNQFKRGDAARKLLLTELDRPDLDAVVSRPAEPAEPARPIGNAYRYFVDQFAALPPDRLADARRTVTTRLTVVSITLEAGDDPHLIFESLNAKGERLTQADLLRNYFLMRLPQGEADAEFARLWKPIESKLGDRLPDFFRHYLMRTADGVEVRSDDVYFHTKERINREAATAEAVVGVLEDLYRFAWYYAQLVSPDPAGPAPDTAALVRRLNRLKFSTAYPFLMNVMDRHAEGKLSADAYPATLRLIESFLVRRLVCGIPTNQLRQIFRGLCPIATEAADTASFLSAVRAAMSHKLRCPSDAIFRDKLIHRPLYGGSNRDVARYLLNRLERSHAHKEGPDPESVDITIEHVMPQTLTREWRDRLTPDHPAVPAADHEAWVNTIGNLTLTGYNSELGNGPYVDKRRRYADSHFALNAYFAGVARWDAAAIAARGGQLADRAVTIWPDVAASRGVFAVRPTRAKPATPTAIVIDGLRVSVTSMLDATVRVFQAMYDRDATAYARAITHILAPARRGSTAADMRTPKAVGGAYLDLHGSGTALRKWCHRLVHAMGLPASTVTFEPA